VIRLSRHLGTVLLLCALVFSILGEHLKVEGSTVTEWTIPTASSEPLGIYVYGGYVYFTEYSGNKIARLDPTTGVFTEWPISWGGGPWDLCVALEDGNVYFTQGGGGNAIGRLDPFTGKFTFWTIPTPDSGPQGISIQKGGLVWFTEFWSNKIGRLDPSTGVFTEWTIPTPNSYPRDIDVSYGPVYFTEYAGGPVGHKIGRFDTITGTFTEWTIPTAMPHSEGIFVYGGHVYFAEWEVNKIGRLDPSTGVFVEWNLPTASFPVGIAASDGYVYFTEMANKIGRLDPATGIFAEWIIPTANSGPRGIAVSGGQVYFTESGGNKIGRLAVSPVSTVTTSVSKTFSIVTTTGGISMATYSFVSAAVIVDIWVVSVTTTRASVTTSIADTVTAELPPPWAAIPTGSTDASPAIACCPFYEQLFCAVKGNGNNAIYLNSMDTATLTWSGWALQPGATANGPALAEIGGSDLYFAVRGMNNLIYWKRPWGSWTAIPTGSTDSAPAIAFFNNKHYAAVKGNGNTRIYLNSMNPTTLVWSGWSLLTGSTPSSPALAASSSHLYMAVRGTNSRIYWRRMDTGGSWTSWTAIPTGSTDASPSIAFLDNRLYLAVKGNGNNAIYLNSMDTDTLTWSGWTALSGSTPNSPALAASFTHLYIAVRGMNDKIYWRRML